MSEPEVTEADRERAMFVLFPELANQVDGYIGGLTFSDEAEANMLAIAAALAAERAKARAPFLALADHLAYRYPTYDSRDKAEESRDAAALIRRAAEETV